MLQKLDLQVTIVDRKRGKILGMENSRFLNQKARILWQFRNLKKNFKDFYEKPLECNIISFQGKRSIVGAFVVPFRVLSQKI